MSYNHNYSFCRKYNSDGSKTKWYAILCLLVENGPMRRTDILDEIWPDRSQKYLPSDRGFCASFFAQLNESGYAYYDEDDWCWHLKRIPSDEECKRNYRPHVVYKKPNPEYISDFAKHAQEVYARGGWGAIGDMF